ncbi:hypothetical protein F4561_002639 [Lipingzhangella halophila]|uniref:Uncharacterized protein n=1 Tax=Lipingzhangella halophila TaxID=1783352 RepID=A0A7W7RH18_9ACTN|nr:hypothetical protein [Lipingzhangella halophila]
MTLMTLLVAIAGTALGLVLSVAIIWTTNHS